MDVIIITKENQNNLAAVLDLGYSDHQAQIFCVIFKNWKRNLLSHEKAAVWEKCGGILSIYCINDYGKRYCCTLLLYCYTLLSIPNLMFYGCDPLLF
jgi:hypothetical protein